MDYPHVHIIKCAHVNLYTFTAALIAYFHKVYRFACLHFIFITLEASSLRSCFLDLPMTVVSRFLLLEVTSFVLRLKLPLESFLIVSPLSGVLSLLELLKTELQRRFFEDIGGGPLILDP